MCVWRGPAPRGLATGPPPPTAATRASGGQPLHHGRSSVWVKNSGDGAPKNMLTHHKRNPTISKHHHNPHGTHHSSERGSSTESRGRTPRRPIWWIGQVRMRIPRMPYIDPPSQEVSHLRRVAAPPSWLRGKPASPLLPTELTLSYCIVLYHIVILHAREDSLLLLTRRTRS